jgi:hypothetical protein
MGFDDLAQQAAKYYRDGMLLTPRLTFRDLARSCRYNRAWYVLAALNEYGGYPMARGKGAKKPPTQNSTNWNTKFVDIPLTGVTFAEIAETFEKEDAVFDAFSDLLADGYRVGFTYNPANDAVICSVTCRDDESVNAGCTFTAFAGNWFDALRVALYKHFVIAEQNWTRGGRDESRPQFG